MLRRTLVSVGALSGALFLFLAACSGDESVSVEVRVVSDLIPGREVAKVTAEIFAGAANETSVGVGASERELELGAPLSRGVSVVTFYGLAAGQYTMWATLERASGEILAKRPLTVVVSEDATFTLTLTADCARAECPSAGGSASFIACLAGQCVDPSCSPAAPEYCPAELEIFCDDDTDCMPRTSCGVAACVHGTCVSDAVVSECGPGEFCSPLSGCTANVAPPGAPEDLPGICGDPCDLPDDGCHYGFTVCGADREPTCAPLVVREEGLPCVTALGAGLCDANGACVLGRPDAGVADASVSDMDAPHDSGASVDAGVDAGRFADMGGDAGTTPCPAGYVGTSVQAGCFDIDECMYNVCDALTTCTNRPGSYECSACPAEYEGDGRTGCVRANGCDGDPCDPLTVCNPSGAGTYVCSPCPTGYLGSGARGCVDVDECAFSACDALTTCTNSVGSYTCSACPSGYGGDGKTGCVDTDECAGMPCGEGAACENTPGSYACTTCAAGYGSDGMGGPCVDIDECALGACDPNAECSNFQGTYDCGVCLPGFSGTNEAGCVDIDECATDNGGCGSVFVGECTNEAGTRTCECLYGSHAARDTCEPNWSQTHYVKRPAGALSTQNFGSAVAMSADGLVLAIGATGDQSPSTGVGGDYAATGASSSGAVYVYRFDEGVWTLDAYIKASNAEALDQFGSGLALSGDGSVLVVGAYGEDGGAAGVNGDQNDNAVSQAGAAYVFRRAPSGWTQEAYLKAASPRENDGFGLVLALSNDGGTVAVGVQNEDSNARGVGGDATNSSATSSGATYVFRHAGGVWTQEAYLKASNAEEGDSFGGAVALSGDGSVLAVGATAEEGGSRGLSGNPSDNSVIYSGAVYLFRRAGSVWTQNLYMKSSNSEAYDRFGSSVALSGDGSRLVVVAGYEDGGLPGVNVDQNDNSVDGAGAAYVFDFVSGSWRQRHYIKTSAPSRNGSGMRVVMSGDGAVFALGASTDATLATGINTEPESPTAYASGAVFVFRAVGTTWRQEAYVKAKVIGRNAAFGETFALSADGSRLLVGAMGERGGATGFDGDEDSEGPLSSGATYLFDWTAAE